MPESPPKGPPESIPESFETERLTLRAPLPSDAAELQAATRESWAQLSLWVPWARGEPPGLAATEADLRQARAAYLDRKDLRLLLLLRGTGTIVGSSGLHRIDWSVPRLEIGYWCRTRFEGQGFIREAVAATSAFAFDVLGARRLEIRCDPRNARSIRIPEALGFRLEGTLVRTSRDNAGRLCDLRVYASTRPDA